MAMNDLAENEFRAKYHVLEHINNEDLRDIFGTSPKMCHEQREIAAFLYVIKCCPI